MLVITHKISLTDLQLTQNVASLSTGDGIWRWDFSLPVDLRRFNNGASLSESLKPTVYCDTGRDLHWYDISTTSLEELDRNFWNRDSVLTSPFRDFVPYREISI